MSSGDPNIQAALDAARRRIGEAAAAAIDPAASALKSLPRVATQSERAAQTQALAQLLQSRQPLLAAFEKALRQGVDEEVFPKGEDPGFRSPTDWKVVGLVGEDQMDERLAFERVGQFISHECEAELRELCAYTGEMLDVGWADPSRNPLRGDIIGAALNEAIETIFSGSDSRRLVSKELGPALAKALPASYRSIIDDLSARGFRPVDLSVRATPSPVGGHRGGAGAAAPAGFEAMRELWEKSMLGRMPVGADAMHGANASIGSSQGGRFEAMTTGAGAENPAVLLERLMQAAAGGAFGGGGGNGGGGVEGGGTAAPTSAVAALSDGDLMRLLRRLNDSVPAPAGAESVAPRPPRADAAWAAGPGFATTGAVAAESAPGSPAATNLIRAHHDELVQASPGQLDHMVIEVVASLFDQIFADDRVPPQIGREIARLQLPVLRVALRDTSFFSSRKHPVRRFINRISALATSFGELEHGPGKELLGRVNALVSEIVEGDFDQVPLYARKLGELEQFIAARSRAEFESSPAAETLQAKEAEWQLEQRFSGRLQEALEPLPVAAYLKEFLTRVWSRAIVAAAQGDDADPAREKRFRRAAFDLVAGVQPKRSVEDRNRFLAGLRGLTATLDEGLALIAWPKDAHDAFFGRLIADHAGSLKAAPGSELDHNMLVRQLDAAARLPLPDPADAGEARPVVGESFEPRFNAREAQRLGLVDEAQVDWTVQTSGTGTSERVASSIEAPPLAGPAIELDLDLATRPAPLDEPPVAVAATPAFPTIELFVENAPKPAPAVAVAAAEPQEPTEGPQLRHHLQVGASYRLQLKAQWEKVRLTYMNPSRTFFLFAHGSGDRGTISMTTRMLQRLCETHRLKSFEDQTLIDRATARVRNQAGAPPAAPAAVAAAAELSIA